MALAGRGALVHLKARWQGLSTTQTVYFSPTGTEPVPASSPVGLILEKEFFYASLQATEAAGRPPLLSENNRRNNHKDLGDSTDNYG